MSPLDFVSVIPEESDEPTRIRIFHGTRLSSARRILENGFRPPAVADQIGATAAEHGIEMDDLSAHMKRTNRWTHLDPRDGVVSVVGDYERAIGWANRSPEAVRDALMSIYRMSNPDPDDDHAWKAEPQFWVIAQQNHSDPPAVVTVEARADTVGRSQPRENTVLDRLRGLAANGKAMDLAEILSLTPEWRCFPEDLTVVAIDRVPVQVDRYVIAYMADESQETTDEQIHQGRWGEPGGFAPMPWWKFADVWQRLPTDRQTELERIAGVSLGAIE